MTSKGDAVLAIATDGSGNLYVTGYSSNGTNNDFATIKYSTVPLLILSKPVVQPEGTVTFSWNTDAGHSYQVQCCTNLTGSNWIDLGGPIAASGSVLSSTNALDSKAQWFYRVVYLP